jgi:hypothetical protein
MNLPGIGRYSVDVVGESNYQKNLERIAGGKKRESADLETTAILLLENDNPYDSNAVRVDINGLTVGYLARPVAGGFRNYVQSNKYSSERFSCKALITGGWDRGNGDAGCFGVYLDLPKFPKTRHKRPSSAAAGHR